MSQDRFKNFTGLPEALDPQEATTDRIHVETVDESRASAMTPMGEINAMGELARESKRQLLDGERQRPAQRLVAALVLFITMLPLLGIPIGIAFYLYALFS